MKFLVHMLLLASFGLLIGCSNSEQVVSNSLIQKRKYRKGFHIKKLQKHQRNAFDNSNDFSAKAEINSQEPKSKEQQSKEVEPIAPEHLESHIQKEESPQKAPKILSGPLASIELVSNHKLFLEDSENLAGRLAGNYLRKLKREVDETNDSKRYGSMSLMAYLLSLLLGVVGIVLLIFGFFEALWTGDVIFLISGLVLVLLGGLLSMLSFGLAIASIVVYAQNNSRRNKRQLIFGLITLALIVLSLIAPYILPFLTFAW